MNSKEAKSIYEIASDYSLPPLNSGSGLKVPMFVGPIAIAIFIQTFGFLGDGGVNSECQVQKISKAVVLDSRAR